MSLSAVQTLTLLFLLFVASGTAASANPFWGVRRPEVDRPIVLMAGRVEKAEFVGKSQNYLVTIRLQRKMSFHELVCLSGMTEHYQGSCELKRALYVTWTLRSNAEVISSGTYRGECYSSADSEIEAYLFNFRGIKGKPYQLEVTSTEDGTPLQKAEPHVLVKIVKPTD